MYFGGGPGCQSVWELHPCSISGLWAVVFSVCEPFCSFFSFLSFLAFWFPISLTVASLQGVAQDFMLSCNHRLTLSLSPVISMSLKSPAATAASSSSRLTQSWFCIAVVFLLALFYSFIYSFICFLGGSILCIPLSVGWLAFVFFSRQTCHPPLCPPCALPWFSAAPVYSSVIGQWVSVLFVCSCVS